jgi:S-adenosylmethionine-dependent methyltransferase
MIAQGTPSRPIVNDDLQHQSIASAFLGYQRSTAGRLRYEQAHRNLRKLHALDQPLRALDAGGGNGTNTAFLLDGGHKVTLYDANPEMISQVRERLSATASREACRLVEGRLEDIGSHLAGELFDLIVCHHVIEYVPDVPALIRALHGLAAPGAELSLITLNPVSEVVRAIVFQQDAAQACAKLENLEYDARWFGQARLYPWEQIVAWADAAGWSLHDYRGIRVLADYVLKADAMGPVPGAVCAMEDAMAGREPYRRFGRYFQFCFRRRP